MPAIVCFTCCTKSRLICLFFCVWPFHHFKCCNLQDPILSVLEDFHHVLVTKFAVWWSLPTLLVCVMGMGVHCLALPTTPDVLEVASSSRLQNLTRSSSVWLIFASSNSSFPNYGCCCAPGACWPSYMNHTRTQTRKHTISHCVRLYLSVVTLFLFSNSIPLASQSLELGLS